MVVTSIAPNTAKINPPRSPAMIFMIVSCFRALTLALTGAQTASAAPLFARPVERVVGRHLCQLPKFEFTDNPVDELAIHLSAAATARGRRFNPVKKLRHILVCEVTKRQGFNNASEAV